MGSLESSWEHSEGRCHNLWKCASGECGVCTECPAFFSLCAWEIYSFIQQAFFFFFEALLLPAPPLIRYSFTWPRHMVDVPHRSSRGKNGSHCLTERRAPCLPPLNTPHSPRLNLYMLWRMLSNHSHECLSYFVLEHSQWHKPQTLCFLW